MPILNNRFILNFQSSKTVPAVEITLKFDGILLPQRLPPNVKGVGITATREGLTDKQKHTLRSILPNLLTGKYGHNMFHHGDCLGGDKDAHKIAKSLHAYIVIHPPLNGKLRAYCEGDFVMPEKHYLHRNKCIVDSSFALIAIPRSKDEEWRSGTWSTVRYARSENKSVFIIFPDGSVKSEI